MISNVEEEVRNLIIQLIERLSLVSNNSEPSFDSFQAIGLAIWDIFSNNNIVINPDGYELDLGSWITVAEIIANSINEKSDWVFENVDFYEGTAVASGVKLADQLDSFTEIFLLLHELGWDWKCGYEIEFNVCVMDGYALQAYKSVYRK